MNVIHELKEYKYLYFCGDVHGQMGELANYTDSIGIKDSIIVTLGDCGFGYIHHKTLKRGILKFIAQSFDKLASYTDDIIKLGLLFSHQLFKILEQL